MLYQLLHDAWQILLFRYQTPNAYRYSPFAVLGVLLLLGLVNAVAMSPLLGGGVVAIVLSILLTGLKWGLLAKVMEHWLNPNQPTSWLGYALVTEAFAIPTLLVFYQPALAGLGLLWQIWTFLAQAFGFMRMGNVSGTRVLVGYVWYFIATMLAGTLLVMLFAQMGLLDLQEIHDRIQQILAQSPAH